MVCHSEHPRVLAIKSIRAGQHHISPEGTMSTKSLTSMLKAIRKLHGLSSIPECFLAEPAGSGLTFYEILELILYRSLS